MTEAGGHSIIAEIEGGPYGIKLSLIGQQVARSWRRSQAVSEAYRSCHRLCTGVWEATGQNQL